MIQQLAAQLYQRATGRPYWTESRPVDIRGTLDGLGPYLALPPDPDKPVGALVDEDLAAAS